MSIIGTRPTRCKLCGGRLHKRDLRCVDCGTPQENPRRQLFLAAVFIGGFGLFCVLLFFLLKYLLSKSV